MNQMKWVRGFVVGLTLFCLLAYALAAIGFGVSKLGWIQPFATDFFALGSYQFMFGLPISAVAAAAIVVVFQEVAPPKNEGGDLSFDAFGAKFSGPAVPATLWIVTYLALVVSMLAVSHTDQPLAQQSQSEVASKPAH
ncbi:hypothetical protein UP09_07490 [Bradyrhizobium sp. LTSP885]|uniref:hypothetical protein n=1 Tax=Bradyrhizobium sp. LTSP885 TaxID=1619232 RepID=UPI0005E3759E|nr:hypothetical protein [Bradyrhizobium sp. LTSP885]KJC49071.1 hypothetical protein UP09_07490 [Bradyrhizobium sp. LTSP885]